MFFLKKKIYLFLKFNCNTVLIEYLFLIYISANGTVYKAKHLPSGKVFALKRVKVCEFCHFFYFKKVWKKLFLLILKIVSKYNSSCRVIQAHTNCWKKSQLWIIVNQSISFFLIFFFLSFFLKKLFLLLIMKQNNIFRNIVDFFGAIFEKKTGDAWIAMEYCS